MKWIRLRKRAALHPRSKDSPPVARPVSLLHAHPKMIVSGIAPSVWLLWRLRRLTGRRRGARLGDPVFTRSVRCDVVRWPVRSLSPRRGVARPRLDGSHGVSRPSHDMTRQPLLRHDPNKVPRSGLHAIQHSPCTSCPDVPIAHSGFGPDDALSRHAIVPRTVSRLQPFLAEVSRVGIRLFLVS